ncbi:hypothetical protein H9P43_006320 [Blastocladiella emersonii ATCC 22665]|nr:hypothetical protein H9P43_006320 [Blastocladiella emersonii ATCC 22665]
MSGYAQIPLHDDDATAASRAAHSPAAAPVPIAVAEPRLSVDDESDDDEFADAHAGESTRLHIPSHDDDDDDEDAAAADVMPLPAGPIPAHPPGAAHHPAATASGSFKKLPADGVFANLSAKPEVVRAEDAAAGAASASGRGSPSAAPVDLPPSYDAAVSDPAPMYWDNTIFTTHADDGELFVEGMPVGSTLTFVLATMASVSFQFVGFLMTYLLATSHAGRTGSKAGFGLTLLQYGIYLRSRVEMIEDGDNPFIDDEFNASLPPNTTPEEAGEILDRTEWVAYFLMMVGWFLVIKSSFEYLRVKKLQAIITASPDAYAV